MESEKFFSNIKDSLVNAPIEVKQSFNRVIKYFAATEESSMYAVCTGDANDKAAWKIVDGKELSRMTRNGYTKSIKLN